LSIIERAASLLRPIEPGRAKDVVSDEKLESPPDFIERAVSGRPGSPDAGTRSSFDAVEQAISESAERFGRIEPRDLAAQSEMAAPAQETQNRSIDNRVSRILRVNRDLLRRQSFLTPDDARTPNVESFRHIKRQILANIGKRKGTAPSNLIAVTSALAGEGKSYCAINLAISIALEKNHTALLVDADVAKPCIPQAFGLVEEQGLTDLLLDNTLALEELLWKTDIGKLSLLPAGTPHRHTTELFASDAMRALLWEMAERYHDRTIIFDSPPLLAASEAGALASQMGQIVMVVEAGRTPEAAVKAAVSRVEANRITGLLLNKGQATARYYGYGGYA